MEASIFSNSAATGINISAEHDDTSHDNDNSFSWSGSPSNYLSDRLSQHNNNVDVSATGKSLCTDTTATTVHDSFNSSYSYSHYNDTPAHTETNTSPAVTMHHDPSASSSPVNHKSDHDARFLWADASDPISHIVDLRPPPAPPPTASYASTYGRAHDHDDDDVIRAAHGQYSTAGHGDYHVEQDVLSHTSCSSADLEKSRFSFLSNNNTDPTIRIVDMGSLATTSVLSGGSSRSRADRRRRKIANTVLGLCAVVLMVFLK